MRRSSDVELEEESFIRFRVTGVSEVLKGTGCSSKDTGFSLKGTGFSPYIEIHKLLWALAPEEKLAM
jgi:hypothetical protein